MFIFSFKTRSSLKFLTTKLFVLCYRVLLISHRPGERGLQQQVAALLYGVIAFEELNDEGSDTVFHA